MGQQKICLIVVVDDEKQVEEYIQAVLGRLGYDQVSFYDPEKAIEYLSQNAGRVDLIVSDILMPGIDGLELARKAAEIKPDVPVILLSGYSEKLPDAIALSNVKSVLHKPVLKTDLVQTVENAVKGCGRRDKGI
jgi:CheY-like chemotaxis protein